MLRVSQVHIGHKFIEILLYLYEIQPSKMIQIIIVTLKSRNKSLIKLYYNWSYSTASFEEIIQVPYRHLVYFLFDFACLCNS